TRPSGKGTAARAAGDAGPNPAVSTRRRQQLDVAQLEARRYRKPEAGSSNLSVQTSETSARWWKSEPRLSLKQEVQVRALASQPDDVSAVVRSLKLRSRPVAQAGGPSWIHRSRGRVPPPFGA